MPRRAKGPRLYLRERAGREPTWVIRDTGCEVGTGSGEADRAGAERALARYIATKYAPQKGPRDLDRLLIADVINVYLKERSPLVKRPDFLVTTATPILDWWGERTLADVRRSSCAEYVTWRTSSGVSDQTARHDLKTLRAAIRYWHAEYGPLPAMPAVTLPAKRPARQGYWLTRAEVARRLWSARHRPELHHACRLLLIGVYSGTRPGAILGLRWLPSPVSGWVDLDTETLHRRGSGEAESAKRAPPARIHRRLLPHLRRWQARDMALGVSHVVHFAGRPVQKLRRSWRSVAGGLAGKDGPHIVRHTAATWLMQAGVDQYEAAGYLGMTPETLWEVYGHHSPHFQQAAANSGRKKAPDRSGA